MIVFRKSFNLSLNCQGRRIQPEAHRQFELGKCGTKIHIHVSLPCTGGSPNLNFRQQSREKHVEVFEELANSVDCLLKKVEEVYGQVSKSLELPANNQYWKSEVLRKVLSNQRPEFEGIVNGCSMKMFTMSQQPVGKRFWFMSNRKEVANRLAERFKCQCIVEHAAFNNVNWTETERYSHVFARYFVRMLPDLRRVRDGFCSTVPSIKSKVAKRESVF